MKTPENLDIKKIDLILQPLKPGHQLFITGWDTVITNVSSKTTLFSDTASNFKQEIYNAPLQ